MKIKRIKTVPRGYRLKPETHKLIARIQKLMNASADEVIYEACRKHYEILREHRQFNSKDLKILNINSKEN